MIRHYFSTPLFTNTYPRLTLLLLLLLVVMCSLCSVYFLNIGAAWISLFFIFAHQIALRILPKRKITQASTQLPLDKSQWPKVTVIVPAHNEGSVIQQTVTALLNHPWPFLSVMVMDDRSSDNTSEQCAGLQLKLPQAALSRYQWHRRTDEATPGKSAVMNDALTLLNDEVDYILVLDADARLPENFFDAVLPVVEADKNIAAVQVPKRISNVDSDKLCLLQDVEYMLDAGVQHLRDQLQLGVELRGNGMLLRPETLALVGGFSEHTLTDDLDMSTKLHASNQPIAFINTTEVHEEGIGTSKALYKQRLRWALGSMRRYLDYAPALLFSNSSPLLKLESLTYGSNFSWPVAVVIDLLLILLLGKLLVINLALWVLSVVALFLVLFLSFIPPLLRPQYDLLQTISLAAWGAGYMVWLWPRVVLLAVYQLLTTPASQPIKWEKTVHSGIRTS